LVPFSAHVVVAAFTLVAAAQAQPRPPLALDEALQLATTQSRLAEAARAQAQAAREMAVAAGQRPDPVLKFGVNNLPVDGPDRWSLTRDFMTMRSVGVMQELTRDDKLQARAARALGEADLAQANQRQVLAMARRDTAGAWLERSIQSSMRELLLAQQVRARDQVSATEAAQRGGKAGLADVLAARMQVEQFDERIAQVDRAIAVATTQLARWVGDEAARPLAARPALTLPDWATRDPASLAAHHPEVAAALQQEALARSDAALTRANRSPDWSVELMFNQRGPSYSNMVSINFSLPLPWQAAQRQDRESAARSAQLAQAQAQREDTERARAAELRTLVQEWHNLDGRRHHHDQVLLPLAQQRTQASLAAYRGGGGSLSGVFDASQAELDIRLDSLRLELEIARLWAQASAWMHDEPAAMPARSTP
jgi:outer membrane protein TolC